MSRQLQPATEGSLSESVQFPPANTVLDQQGNGSFERRFPRMAMAPPISSASRAPARPAFQNEENRGTRCLHGGFDRPEFDYSLRRQSYSDHLGLHSGTLIEQLLLQENQKALRMASLVQSQASGCLSGCLSCDMNENRLRFKDHEDRLLEEHRWGSRSSVQVPSKSVHLGLEVEDIDSPDRWFRQPRPRLSHGEVEEGSTARLSFSGEEVGHLPFQGRRSSYPGPHSGVSQASQHVQDEQIHSVGPTESSVPIHGYSDGEGRLRQRWCNQRQTRPGNGTDDEVWQTVSRSGSKVGPSSARDQDCPTSISMPGIATGSMSRNSGRTSQGLAGASIPPSQRIRPGLRENPAEVSDQENVGQQAGTQRVVTQGPVTLTNWYLIKVQDTMVGRVLETRIAVGGWLIDHEEHVKTAPIAHRLDFRKVVTEDGVELSLEGSMNQETSIANGFSAGIVQCLTSGFPYIWKQYMRVRTVGQSSSLAVSGSLGVHDANTSKAISEELPNPRDYEGNSPGAAVVEEITNCPTGVHEAQETIEPEAVQMVVVGTLNTADVGNRKVVLQKQNADGPSNTLGPESMSEACVGNTGTEVTADKVEDGSGTLDLVTTSTTVRTSRKNKKVSVQPVRSSRRLQQRQLLSNILNARDSPELATITGQVENCGSNVMAEALSSKLADANMIMPEEEQLDMDCEGFMIVERATTGTFQTDELQVENSEDLNQGPAEFVVPEVGMHPMELEKGSEHASSHVKMTTEGEAVVKTAQEAAEVPLRFEDPAPITPPELVDEVGQRKAHALHNLGSVEAITQTNSDTCAPFTRSLKRTLRFSDGDCPSMERASQCAPVTRSLRRLQRLSDGVSTAGEALNRITPLQTDESDSSLVKTKQRKSLRKKVVNCSMCKEPTLHSNLEENCVSKNVSIELSTQQSHGPSQKLELQESAPLTDNSVDTCGTPELPSDVRSDTRTVRIRPRASQQKQRKTATEPINKGKSRKSKTQDAGEGSSVSHSQVPLRQSGRRRSILPPPLPPPRVQDKSKVPEAFGLKTSRSGRLLVPPLAYWRSQSIGYDMDGGIIAIFDGFEAKPADTGCFTFTPPQEKQAKKIQKKLCKAAVTVTKGKQSGRR